MTEVIVATEEVIKSEWEAEALAYRTAGETLRSATDGDVRIQALGDRMLRLERSDTLLDAWLDSKS